MTIILYNITAKYERQKWLEIWDLNENIILVWNISISFEPYTTLAHKNIISGRNW